MENSKNEFKKTMERNKINIKKLDSSIKSFDYFTQNFFDRNIIVPSIHIGDSSRVSKTESTKASDDNFKHFAPISTRNEFIKRS